MSDLQSVIHSMREVQQRLDNSSKTIFALAKGNEKIASLRLERDIAKETYKAGLDAMNNLRTEASLLQSILRWQNDMGS
ncbi:MULTISPECIES: hypothetical protein [Bacillaceae]|uniref:hypothetical protein n=1 Tax=Shouchella oshimensis TaxID=290588 RepID=UPI0006EC0272|nr:MULTISPECIES: hypothetical protein [Bacillaceae]